MKINNKGFTYMEIIVSVMVMFFTLMFFTQLDKYNSQIRAKSDEESRMSMVAQGVMDAYRNSGKVQALSYNQEYTVNITESLGTGRDGLKKVTVTVQPKLAGIGVLNLVTYENN